MEKVGSRTFDDIVKLAEDFVIQKKGAWDHAAWQEFLSTLQKQGFDLSAEVQDYLGQVLEAMKSFYQATASVQGIEKALSTVAQESVQFVKERQAVWGHGDWESFVNQVQKNTLMLSAETTAYLGGILESVKALYQVSPAATPDATKTSAATSAGEQKTRKPAKTAKQPKGTSAEAKDDLTAISGIGPALQRKLNDCGIHRFAQIAELSEKDVEGLEENIIKFAGRIKRDDWIGQARRFTEEMRQS